MTVQHSGRFENGVASSSFSIVENSGTDELEGIEGSGSFVSGASGQADYPLQLVK